MSLDRLVTRWVGVAITLIGVVATVALVVTGQLALYIHPRYTIFTAGMALLAGVACLAAMILLPVHERPHDHSSHDGRPSGRATASEVAGGLRRAAVHPAAVPAAASPVLHRSIRSRSGTLARLALVLCAVLALLVLPPATLTATTLQNRDLASPSRIAGGTDVRVLVGADPTTLSVKDWAGLLQQGGPEAVVNQPVRVSGYLIDGGDDSTFIVARLLISCCAVDGQPVGIPVHRPGWRSEFQPGDWLSLDGTFTSTNAAGHPAVVEVDSLEKIAEPDQPYVF